MSAFFIGSEAEHALHVVAPGRLVSEPERRLHSSTREDCAVFGAVANFDALAFGCKDDLMIARDRSAPKRRKTKVASLTCPSDAIPAARQVGRAACGARGGP